MRRMQKMVKIVTPFTCVLNYRKYGLTKKRSALTATEDMEVEDLKRRIDGLNLTLGNFKGKTSIKLFLVLSHHEGCAECDW